MVQEEESVGNDHNSKDSPISYLTKGGRVLEYLEKLTYVGISHKVALPCLL